jgi:hypothetical protein
VQALEALLAGTLLHCCFTAASLLLYCCLILQPLGALS